MYIQYCQYIILQKMEDINESQLSLQPKLKYCNINKNSPDSLDTTFHNSIIINNNTSYTVSINNNNNNNNSISNNNIPLHSHYLYKNSPSLHNNNSNSNNNSMMDISVGVINSGLRLLNPVVKSQRKCKNQEGSLGKTQSKLAFGSSEVRKIDIFQGKQQNIAQNNNNTASASMSQIMYKACLKNSERQSQKRSDRHKSEQVSFTTQNSSNNTKLGFGMSSFMERIATSVFHKGNPGPGSYQINANFNKKVSQSSKKLHKQQDKKCILIETEDNQRQIGPGSYNLPTFSSQRQQYVTKQKWKQRFTQKKQKMKDLIQKLNKNRLKTTPTLQQQSHSVPKSPTKVPDFVHHSQKQNKTHTKLLRNKLKQRTQNYLPKVQQKYALPHNLFKDQFRGSPSNFKFSNCFVAKNDHAYQAHYYQAPEKEGEYIFIKGKYR